jgi:hypothetical protein
MSSESKFDTSAIESLAMTVVDGLRKAASELDSSGRPRPDRLPRIKATDAAGLGAQIRNELNKVRETHRTRIDKRRSELDATLVLRKKRLEQAGKTTPPVVPTKEGMFIVRGRIVDANEKIGLPNVVVKAFDMDRKYDDQLGSTLTDENGYYAIAYSAKDFKDVFDNQPETYIAVLDGDGNTLYTSPRSFVHKAGVVEEIDAAIDGQRIANQLELAKSRVRELELQRKEADLRGTILSAKGLRVPVR